MRQRSCITFYNKLGSTGRYNAIHNMLLCFLDNVCLLQNSNVLRGGTSYACLLHWQQTPGRILCDACWSKMVHYRSTQLSQWCFQRGRGDTPVYEQDVSEENKERSTVFHNETMFLCASIRDAPMKIKSRRSIRKQASCGYQRFHTREGRKMHICAVFLITHTCKIQIKNRKVDERSKSPHSVSKL